MKTVVWHCRVHGCNSKIRQPNTMVLYKGHNYIVVISYKTCIYETSVLSAKSIRIVFSFSTTRPVLPPLLPHTQSTKLLTHRFSYVLLFLRHVFKLWLGTYYIMYSFVREQYYYNLRAYVYAWSSCCEIIMNQTISRQITIRTKLCGQTVDETNKYINTMHRERLY